MTIEGQPVGWGVDIPAGLYNPSIKYGADGELYLIIGTDSRVNPINGAGAYKRSVDAINSFNRLTGSDAFPTS
jgi:hypothetical protein